MCGASYSGESVLVCAFTPQCACVCACEAAGAGFSPRSRPTTWDSATTSENWHWSPGLERTTQRGRRCHIHNVENKKVFISYKVIRL